MLRKAITGVLLAALIMTGCKNEDRITVEGSYPDGKGALLKLEMLNIAEKQFIDSVRVDKKGSFEFNFELAGPELVLLQNDTGEVISLLVHPGDEIRVDIPQESFNEGYSLTGSDESEKIRMLAEKMEDTRSRLDSITDLLSGMEDLESPEADVLISSYQQIFVQQKRKNIRFIVENLNSLASIYALYQRVAPEVYIMNDLKDLQYFKIVADSARVKYPQSTLVRSLAADVDNRIADYNSRLTLSKLTRENVTETGLIDLEIENVAGEEISLSSLQGKVVLLNFWGSWNQDSRDATRSLKNVYRQYHDRGFEIYSVALENDRNTWRAALDFEEYPWINVSELTYPYSYAANVYNVKNIPTNFLIDRNGTIVAKNLSGKVLATWLDNLL